MTDKQRDVYLQGWKEQMEAIEGRRQQGGDIPAYLITCRAIATSCLYLNAETDARRYYYNLGKQQAIDHLDRKEKAK